jgi:hypothetical protein
MVETPRRTKVAPEIRGWGKPLTFVGTGLRRRKILMFAGDPDSDKAFGE